MVGEVNNISVLSKNEICSSDHYGITFSVKKKVRPKVIKRRMLNYKKADWDSLNAELKSVRWDHHLKYCDAETGWQRFCAILNCHISHHIPVITVKCKDQPPWFDSDTHRLCLKKERLRAKYKQTGLSRDYQNFSACRKKFKELCQRKCYQIVMMRMIPH